MTPGLAHWDDVWPLDLRRRPMELDRIDLEEAAVDRATEEIHTLIAGDDGLGVLAFGERTRATAT